MRATVTGYSGITENTSSISLYPNPANAVVTVNVAPTATVAVYNMAGALVYSANGNVKMIDVSAFNAGVYQVVVTDNNAVSTERLIVK